MSRQETVASTEASITDNIIQVLSITTHDPVEVANEPAEKFYGKDNMPEMYDPEKREDIDFDLFDTDHDRGMRFKKSLVCFSDVEKPFFFIQLFTEQRTYPTEYCLYLLVTCLWKK